VTKTSSTQKRRQLAKEVLPLKKRPHILVCNDDGIDAEGIAVLAESMKKIGNVTVVAPSQPQSGMSHAMTLGRPLRIQKVNRKNKFFGYAVQGTPVDCIKVAITHILDSPPDLIVSGINYGSNTAINILYSGTVAAAVEGTSYNIPSIAFSLTTYENADFTYSGKFARKLARQVLKHGLPPETLLTVNIPNLPESKIKGVVVTRQGKSRWKEEMIERHDAYGQPYYWLSGTMDLLDSGLEDDEYAVRHDHVSVTPLCYNMTHHAFIKTVQDWQLRK
jgi:5'-nucleotidase